MSGNGSLRSSHAPSLRNNGGVYATSVLLVQEKGALSTFKVLYNRLRRDWELDAPRSPGIGIGLGVAGASPQLR